MALVLACAVAGTAILLAPHSLAPSGAQVTASPPTRCEHGCGARRITIEVIHLALVDRTRPLVEDGRVLAPARALPTVVWRPNGGGPFPLVVFVHGYDITPLAYARFCRSLARAGFVVAAPSFPLEDPTRGFGVTRSDLPNEAVDVSFVVDALYRSPLRSSLAQEVAVVGHSDGADVALMVGYELHLFDPRVRAIVADAPDPIDRPIRNGGPPLLLIQGDADPVVPYASSQEVFAELRVPTAYVTLLGAGHLPPIQGGTRWTASLDASVRLFLDCTLARQPLRQLEAALRRLPETSLWWRWPGT